MWWRAGVKCNVGRRAVRALSRPVRAVRREAVQRARGEASQRRLAAVVAGPSP